MKKENKTRKSLNFEIEVYDLGLELGAKNGSIIRNYWTTWKCHEESLKEKRTKSRNLINNRKYSHDTIAKLRNSA